MGKIGREYLLTVKGCLPADDADDPKYAEARRELIQSGKGIFTEHGLLFVDENTPFERDYDGQNFPAYVYDRKCFASYGLSTTERPNICIFPVRRKPSTRRLQGSAQQRMR